jgi:large subunit ribosomal protein L18
MKSKKVKFKTLGTKDRPRVSVTRSNKYLFAQLVDDENQKTLISGSDRGIKLAKSTKKDGIGSGTKVLKAFALGEEIAKNAKKKKISTVVFDRGSYRYHGRVKALAEGLRGGGLKV